MPELTTVSPEPVIEPPVTVTVSVFPTPASPVIDPAPPVEVVPPAPAGPVLDDAVVRDLIDGINGMNTVMQGDTATGGVLLLDPVQFGVLGVALALVVALLAALFVLSLRR